MKFRSIDIYNHCGVILERFRTRTAMSYGNLSLYWPAIGSCAAGSEYACLNYKMTAFFTTERILNVLKACLTLTNKMFPPWSNHTRQNATRKPSGNWTSGRHLNFCLVRETWGECKVRVRGSVRERSSEIVGIFQNFRKFRFGSKWKMFHRLVPLENSRKKWKI